MRLSILYQDDDLLVVDKPVGVATHAPDPADPCPSDALRLAQLQAELPYLGMHQRLDADTSGVLLFSARPAANPALAEAFSGREVRKVYLALVHGVPRAAEGVIEAPIVRDRDGRYRVASPADPRGQPARTRYRTLEADRPPPSPGSLPGAGGRTASARAGFSLLEIVPETGRSHQIRVHLAHIGHPIVGDPLYAPAGRWAPRLCLHAQELALSHPARGRRMSFTAPTPGIFRLPGSLLAEIALLLPGSDVRSIAERPEVLRALVGLAVERRAPLAADPATTIYRLVNGAGDGLRGLTVDRYGDVLVAGLYDEETLPPRPMPPSLAEALAASTGVPSVYVKHRPKQASRIPSDQLGSLAPAHAVLGADRESIIAWEDGLAYLIRPAAGLSTGLYPDMREGRARVRAWSKNRRVLNCFAYTCGFGVAATAGGAQRVLNLDLSKSVLEWGRENYRANGCEPDPHDFVFGDVFDWISRLARRGERFDLVILDPPGFSTTKKGRFSAARDYGALAELAAGVTAPGGLLLACCNLAELPWRAFRDRVLEGVAAAGRAARAAGVYHEPAVDFPCVPGTDPYLKMLLVELR